MVRKYKNKSHCYSCKEYKDFDKFYKDASKPDGCSSHCKECSSKYGIKHYKKYKKQYLKRGVERRKRGRELLEEVKGAVGCISCDESRVPCLDFHHEYPGDKLFTLGDCSNKNPEALKNEMKKCIVICSNCHRILHSKEASLNRK